MQQWILTMARDMLDKHWFIIEAFTACVTSKPVLSRMLRQMILLSLRTLEDLATVFTGIAFTLMSSHMFRVPLHLHKAPPAYSAEVRVSPSMMLHV